MPPIGRPGGLIQVLRTMYVTMGSDFTAQDPEYTVTCKRSSGLYSVQAIPNPIVMDPPKGPGPVTLWQLVGKLEFVGEVHVPSSFVKSVTLGVPPVHVAFTAVLKPEGMQVPSALANG